MFNKLIDFFTMKKGAVDTLDYYRKCYAANTVIDELKDIYDSRMTAELLRLMANHDASLSKENVVCINKFVAQMFQEIAKNAKKWEGSINK